MTRSQVAALVVLAVLFLIAVVILTVQIVWGSGGLQLDELPGSG
jgi:hypothetical protein